MLLRTVLVLLSFSVSAQERVGHLDASRSGAESVPPRSAQTENVPSNYVLGPDDQITLLVSDAEEMSNKPIRVDMRGNINLPMAGRVHAAGLTVDQLETDIEDRLKKFLNDPEVVVTITDFHSQPVSLLGAVTQPGVHQLQGHKTLFQVLSEAGGLRPDAGNTVKITRDLKWGRIPLADAKDDNTGEFSVASVSSKSIMDGTNPAENITVKPDDVISVPKADLIYVIGSVHRPGGFTLGEKESLSALQVLSLAEGLDKTAAPDKARIMRVAPGTANRTEISVNLKKLMAGKAPDLALKSDDILFVPNSTGKVIAARTAEAAISIGSGLAIYARP